MAPQGLLRPDRVADLVNRATRVIVARETFTVAAGDDPTDPDNWKPMGSSSDDFDDAADSVRTGAKVISIGAIVGIVIGCLVFLTFAICLCVACSRASRRDNGLARYRGNRPIGNGVTYGPGVKDARSSVGTDDGPPPSYEQSSQESNLSKPEAAQIASHHGGAHHNNTHAHSHDAAAAAAASSGGSGGSGGGGGGGA